MAFADVQFRVHKTGDREFARRVVELVGRSPLPVKGSTVEFVGGGPPVTVAPAEEPVQLSQFGTKVSATLVSHATLSFDRASIQVQRQQNQPWDKVSVSLKGLNETPAEKRANGQVVRQAIPAADVSVENIRELLTLAKEVFRSADTPTVSPGGDLAEHYAARDAELTRLQEVAETTIRNFTEQSLRLQAEYDEQYRERRRVLEEEQRSASAQRSREQDKFFDDAAAVLEEKEKALREREAAVEARAKELDDRDSRHARRRIRQDLKKAFEARAKEFSLTADTKKMRWIIHVVAVVLLLLFAGGAVVTGVEITALVKGNPTTGALWLPSLRQLLFAGAFTGMAIFYLRWNNSWFQQHAEEEFRLKQLEIDFDRASWVVEMSMEWKEGGGEELPAELLSRLTAELFTRHRSPEEALHPADQLASALLGSSAELEVNLPHGAGRARLDRKGIRNLRKG